MARFFGVVGYGESVETPADSGVWKNVITERQYKGELITNNRALEDADKVNKDLSVGNQISIVADAYAYDHFFAMKYVKWQGALWTVSSVTVERPRLLLRLGGLYNGATSPAPSAP